jgi:hypothetical protein
VLLIGRARDPATWRWLAPDVGNGATKGTAADDLRDDVVAPEPAVSGPTDRDPLERDAAREELEAVTDKSPLAKEEMPAYWRLMAWQQHESLTELRKRARTDVTFKQLWQQPDKWRGKLVEIPVHLRQTTHVDDLPDNALGLKSMCEVWGWTTDSQPYSYWFVCPRLPPGMPSGANIAEEATFVGYFLKLLPYEDHEGISRATPLLIGRLVWHPTENPLARSDEWMWPWIGGGVLAILFAARWGLTWAGRKPDAGEARSTSVDELAVVDWLDGANEGPVDPENEPGNGHANRLE